MTESGRRLLDAARRFGSHETGRVILGAALRATGLALACISLFVLLDRLVALPALVRASGVAAVVGVYAFIGMRALRKRLPALRNLEEAARATERQSDTLRDHLVPAMQILRVREDSRTGYSPGLVDAFVDETIERVRGVNPNLFPYNESFKRNAVLALGGGALATILVFVVGPSRFAEGILRFPSAFAELGPSPKACFFVEPGDVSIPRGEDVVLSARIENARIEHGEVVAQLQFRTEDTSPWKEVALATEPFPIPLFEHRFEDVRESFRYRFAHEGELSNEFTVSAMPHPSVTVEEVRYDYPAYTGLTDRVVSDGSGDLAAVKGTRATLLIRCTNAPKRAEIVLTSGERKEMKVAEDGRLTSEIEITDEDSYEIAVEDTLGLTNQNALRYGIRSLLDEAPFIRLVEPGEDTDLDESLHVALRYSAIDDYGLGPVELVWEVSRRQGEVERLTIFVPNQRIAEIDRTTEWNLQGLELLPGDTVTYHLEVRDNNAIDGPSTARTREYVLRFPSLAEIYAEIDEGQEQGIEKLQEAAEEAKRVQEKVEEISREILKRGDSSWENRKEVERALETQENLAEEMQKIQDEIGSNLDRLADSEFMTLEALQKMEKVQQLLDEVATEEMKQALEKLREAMEQANARRMQENLTEFQQTQEELMQSLDRIIENLKQFQLEERLKAAVRELEELAARQERVNEELDRAKDEKDSSADSADKAEGRQADSQKEGDDQKKSEAEKAQREESGSEKSEKKEGLAERGDQKDSEKDSKERADDDLERLAREEEALSEEAKRVEKELEELSEMAQELRDSQDAGQMKNLSEQMKSEKVPQTMGQMVEEMQQGDKPGAQEQGEKALTQLERLLEGLSSLQAGMAMKMAAINQAAINRAVRDLLSLSNDEESLASQLGEIPRNSTSATRSFADEQYLLLQGTERVEKMLQEVAKNTPLMESHVGKKLDEGIDTMKDAAYGLENGAVQVAHEDGKAAVEDLNAVVIALLETAKSMSSCQSGMPGSGMMQQLQDLAGDQDKLNKMLQEILKNGGMPLDRRLQSQLKSLSEEQRRIQQELQKLLEEGGGDGLLGRLDDVSGKLDEVAKKLARGELDDETLREQSWAVTRLLDAQRSIRERDFGRERRSETGEQLSDLLTPPELAEGLDEEMRNLRQDLLKALERRYPPKYEELIRRYFRSLTDDAPAPDLP